MDNSQPNTQQKAPQSQVNIMALLGYIGILCLIPILSKSQDEFVRFHAKQGLVLFIGEVATLILLGMTPALFAVWNLVNLGWFVLSVIGIINVTKNEKKQIPFLGQFADKIKI